MRELFHLTAYRAIQMLTRSMFLYLVTKAWAFAIPIPGTDGRKSHPARTHMPTKSILSLSYYNGTYFWSRKGLTILQLVSLPINKSLSKCLKEGTRSTESNTLFISISSPLP